MRHNDVYGAAVITQSPQTRNEENVLISACTRAPEDISESTIDKIFMD